MATASDDFNRADGGLGSNWTTAHNGGGQIISNAYAPVTNYTSEAAFYSGTTFLTNQYSQAKRGSFGEYAGIAVRCSAGGNYYAWFHNGALQKFVGGSYTTLGTFATFGVGPTIRLEIVGNTLQGFINGVLQFTYTDSSSPLTTGQPGLATYNMADGCRIDDWEGGDLPPTLTGVSPGGGAPGTTVAVTLTGSAFVSGATVAVSGADVTVSSVVVVSATSITADFAIGAGAAVGVRMVSVTTPGGTSGGGTFVVTIATAMDDFNRADGSPGANWTLFANGGMLISGNGVVPNGLSEAGHFWNAASFSDDHYSQVRRVSTGNYGGPAVRCSWGGTIYAASCIYWLNDGGVRRMIGGGVTPLTTQVGFSSGDVATLAIEGTVLRFYKNGVLVGTLVDSGAPTTGAPGIIFGNNIDTPVVKLDDWSAGDLAPAPPPSLPLALTGIAPPAGTQGTAVVVTLTGTGFVVGATSVAVSGTGVAVSDVLVGENETSLTATFTIAAAATLGPRDVTVTTAEGTTDPVPFIVLAPVPVPTLTGISPDTGMQGTTVAVTLTGTGFVVGQTSVVVAGDGVGVVATSVVVVNATTITATFVINAAAALGPHSVSVTTATGTSGPLPFTVLALAGPPTLAGIVPPSGMQGTSVAVLLTGTAFVEGATTVSISGTGVTIDGVAVSSATSMSATFVLAPGATLGGRTVTVATGEGTSGPLGFTVLAPTVPGEAPPPGEPSLYQSRSDVCLSGVAISSNTTRHLHIVLHGPYAGLDITCHLMDTTGITITKSLSGGLSEFAFAVRALAPAVATPITVDLGLVPIWGGTISGRQSSFLHDIRFVQHDMSAIDWRWLLDRWRLVSGSYQHVAVNVLVAELLRDFVDPASGFTTGDISMALGVIPIIEFSEVTVSDALTRIAQATTATLYGAGAFWRIRPDKAVDVGVQWGDAPLFLTHDGPLPTCYESLTHEQDMSQLRNEIRILAGGAKVLAATPAGSTDLPITNELLYNPAGGVVRCRGLDISYVGVRPTPPPPLAGVLYGCVGITADLPAGDEVQPLITQTDAAAQADIATALGAGQSGRIAVSRENRQLSWSEATGAAVGELEQYAQPIVAFEYGLTTPGARLVDVGKLVDAYIELPGVDAEHPAEVIDGVYRVQDVTLTSITSPALAGPDPRLRVQLRASPARARTWYDFVKQEPDRKAR